MLPRVYVSRPRLLRRLLQATQCKLTVICAGGPPFLAGQRPRQVAVEVKYQNRVGSQDTLAIRNALGRGIVLMIDCSFPRLAMGGKRAFLSAMRDGKG